MHSNNRQIPSKLITEGLRRFLKYKESKYNMPNIGITAFVPPEIFYKEGCRPVDLANWVRGYNEISSSKLCAWSASWRSILIADPSLLDALVIVAGDCHNSMSEAQHILYQTNMNGHYFVYPFDGDTEFLSNELEKLSIFLSNISKRLNAKVDKSAPRFIKRIKHLGCKLDELRWRYEIDVVDVVKILGSFTDLDGDLNEFYGKCVQLYDKLQSNQSTRHQDKIMKSVGLIGVPPIMEDFHEVCAKIGLRIVFDEMRFEFVSHSGTSIEEMAESYAGYSFVRPLWYRLEKLKQQVEKRSCIGLIHYTQYGCHHVLEDPILRQEFDIPILTLQCDIPRPCDRQTLLRLEAFYESL